MVKKLLSNITNKNRYNISAQEQLLWAHSYLTPDVAITLKEKIDINKFKQAIIESLEFHPLYKTHLIKDETKHFQWEENNKKPIIKKYNPKEHIVYGTDKYNNFPWLIRYSKKTIFFNVAHMLSDGVGLLNFIKTFLTLYFKKIGVQFKLDVIDQNVTNLTTEDSYLKYGKTKKKYAIKKQVELQPKVVTKKLLADDEETSQAYRCSINKIIIKDMAYKYNVKPFTIMASFLVKALEKSTNIKTGNINIPIPVNCRKYFSSNTDRNFIYATTLNYNVDTMKDMSLISVAKEFTKQLNHSITKKNMIVVFQELFNLTKQIKENHKLIYDIRKNLSKVNKKKTTTITYSHITNISFPDELNNLIESIELSALTPLDSAILSVFGVDFNNKMVLAIKDILKGNTFINNLQKLFKQENIEYTLVKLPNKVVSQFNNSI